MLYLLFVTIFLESAMILSMLFRTPARKLVVLSLDRVKRGRGPIVAKSVAGTVFALLVSSLNNALKIWRQSIHGGSVNPTDQVLMANHLLEASLMGFFLFLALLTDRLHYYIRELHMRRKSDASRRNDGRFGGLEEIKAREEQVGTFKDIVRQLGSELDAKADDLAAADAKMSTLKKHSDALLLDFDRVVSENQEFRSRLQSLNQQLSCQK